MDSASQKGALRNVLPEAPVALRVPGEFFWKPHFYLGALETKSGENQDAIEQLLAARKLFPLNSAVSQFWVGPTYSTAKLAGPTPPQRHGRHKVLARGLFCRQSGSQEPHRDVSHAIRATFALIQS